MRRAFAALLWGKFVSNRDTGRTACGFMVPLERLEVLFQVASACLSAIDRVHF